MITEAELNELLSPSRQIYTGNLENPDSISRNLPTTGQLNPQFANHFASQNGRYLSGLGATSMSRQPEQVAERAEHAEIYDLEGQDDVLGSGIFDPYRRPPTANSNVGVFASHYSLPGYHARERPFEVNTEITDLTADAQVVGIPSGGMAYIEHGGAQPYPQIGPSAPSMRLGPAATTNQYEPYVELPVSSRSSSGDWGVDSLLSRGEPQWMHPGGALPQLPPGAYGWPSEAEQGPASVSPGPNNWLTPIPAPKKPATKPLTIPAGIYQLPGHPAQNTLIQPGMVAASASPQRSGRTALGQVDYMAPGHLSREPMFRVQQLPGAPRRFPVPGYPGESRVPQRMAVSPVVARAALGAADGPDLKWVAFLGAGIAIGVAARIYLGKE